VSTVFQRLGHGVCRHRRAVVGAWLAAILVAAGGAQQLPHVVVGGSGPLEGSSSQRMDAVLHAEFDYPYSQPLIVAISSERQTADDSTFLAWIEEAATRLRGLPEVREVASYAEHGDSRLRSADGHRNVLLVGLNDAGVDKQERAVPAVRAALQELRTTIRQSDPDAQLAVAGHAALTYDMNDYNKREGDRAEMRALPLTFCILVLVFGALIAAGVPLVMGVASTTLALGLAYLLALIMPVSNLLQNIVLMLGLALGIDYSLLLVSRFREALPGRPAHTAAAVALSEVGATIAWSGLTVTVGLLGLLFSPLMETRSIGIGGALVVLVSVLAATTLLPAVLALLGPRIDWPSAFSSRLRNTRSDAAWRRAAALVVRHPFPAALFAACIAGVLAFPGTKARGGFDNEPWFYPVNMESRLGGQILARMGNANAGLPLYLVVRAQDDLPVLSAAHVPVLVRYAERLGRDPRVAEILSPVTHPHMSKLLLSRDRQAALFQVTAKGHLGLLDVQLLARDLEKLAPDGPFLVQAGGPPVYYNDFDHLMRASFPVVIGFVVGATLLLLFIAFKSFLLPLKAVATNFLAVAAGYGAVVAVFQLGFLHPLVGLERPLAAIPLTVPLMIFCLSFGLSMDYEVFLLSRIKHDFEATGDNRSATASGLAGSGPIITGAALIMAAVFGAFVGAEIVLLKMIGFGLCVTVLVDATLVRTLLVPAMMVVAGRWNWYPGIRRPAKA